MLENKQGWISEKIIWRNGKRISDSRKIKDENTMDVLDGVLFIAFTDGTEDDMIAEVNKHANESDTIDGVQYETYETDNSDGVAMIDMCAATGDANAFVKALLNKWGIAENVADLEFEASDEMKEAVNDSRKQVRDNKDYLFNNHKTFNPPVSVALKNNLTWEVEQIHLNGVKNDYISGGIIVTENIYQPSSKELVSRRRTRCEFELDLTNNSITFGFYVPDKAKQTIIDLILENFGDYTISDSRVNDMTKPVHLRGYAEKMRAKRRNKNADDEPNTDEEKSNVSDSRIRDNALPSFDINGFTGEPAVAGDYYKLTYGRETIYQDSANEDCYDEDSAYAFFEELLNGIGKQGQLAIQAAIDNGFTVSGTDSIETVWQDACDFIIDNTEHTMEYCELNTNGRSQHYDFGEYWQDGEIFDFGWHYKESDHVLFKQEGNDFVWVNWYDIPMDGEPDRSEYGFVFDTIVYDGEAIDLYDMFE
jgi:hypothetical protein